MRWRPRADASAYPSMEGDAKLRIITLDESRGCPYHCHFCIQPAIIGHKVRLRAATSVVDGCSAACANTR